MKPSAFAYARPKTLDEAIGILAASEGEAKAIAGGQSLIPMLAFRLSTPKLLVDIGRIPGLNRIDVTDSGVHLGALVRWRDIERDSVLLRAHPLLVAAIRHVAHYQIRNRGTVGGSLAHADPAAELAGIAVTCEAEITTVGRVGKRKIAAANFFTGPLTTALEPDELVVELRLPPGHRHDGGPSKSSRVDAEISPLPAWRFSMKSTRGDISETRILAQSVLVIDRND